MRSNRQLPLQTRRDAWVEVNLTALEQNARQIRSLLPDTVQLMAIVKADAYGHGAVMTIPTLVASGVSMVGVAAMDEALQIRNAGLDVPILVIGAIPDWAMQLAADEEIQLTIFSEHHLQSLKRCFESTGKRVKVHVKVDTGMHRIGIHLDEALAFIQTCQAAPYLQLEGIFSHLACAEDSAVTAWQQEQWLQLLAQLPADTWPPYRHFANSLGTLGYPVEQLLERHCNLVRLGIAFFGYLEQGQLPPSLELQPVLGLKGRITHLQTLPPETGVSYGFSYHTPGEGRRKIATIPIGYADGVPRALSNKMSGLLRGQRIPQVGTITMDQMMFDVTDSPDVAIGDAITLLGNEDAEAITLTEWAKRVGTIEYELMCSLRVRLPKVYTRS